MAKLVHKIKKLMAAAGNKILNKTNAAAVSVGAAKQIQRNTVVRAGDGEKSKITPPYLSIAEQLDSPQEQVFQGALHNLAKIALNHRHYRKDILGLLHRKAGDDALGKVSQDLLAAKIAELENFYQS